jgi:hypothetical protein
MATKKRKDALTFREHAAFISFAGKRSEKYAFGNHISPISEPSSPWRLCSPEYYGDPVKVSTSIDTTGVRSKSYT